ncbi:hypothetical protein BDR04DRAFT_1226848 [Suillus decipiens]|nr:hypothetical protein BDR04DRAFT_1226848 [Suillus decipiens]
MANNQASFQQLNLGVNYSPKDEPLRRSLGCPPDDVRVNEGNRSRHFVANIRIRLFQKRLRITQSMGVEFVARGCIWKLHFYLGQSGIWWIVVGLSRDSLPAPAQLCCEILINPHEEEHQAVYSMQCVDPRLWGNQIRYPGDIACLPPPADKAWDNPNPEFSSPARGYHAKLCNLVMDDDTRHVDCNGTLHATVKIKQKQH